MKNRHRGRASSPLVSLYSAERIARAEQFKREHAAAMEQAAEQLPALVRLADGRELRRGEPRSGGYTYRCVDGMRVVASYDPTPHGLLLHVSISYAKRDPRWKDLRQVRDAFFPPDLDVIQVLPRASEYVNVHQHCFHLFQAPEVWQGGWNV